MRKVTGLLILFSAACAAQYYPPGGSGTGIIACATTPPTRGAANSYCKGTDNQTYTCNVSTPPGCTTAGQWATVSGSGTFVQLSGDATSTTTGGATTVVGINGTTLSSLGTGILKNTTGTGIPSIAAYGDVVGLFGGGTCSGYLKNDGTCGAGGGTGTVTSVGWTGGIVTIASPTTTPAFTIAGTSGGIPYFNSATTWTSSGALTGLMRGNGAGAVPTAAELSGDVTTSGSNAVTVAKVNGTSVPTNSAADQVLLTTASTTGSWASIANCTASGGVLQYNTTTHAFSCHTLASADIPANAANTSGTAAGLSSTLAVASGGTGTASTLTGLVRGSASAMTAAELSGDVTTSGSNAATVTKINGTSLAGLSTGILKNTTGTGVPSIAVAADFPIGMGMNAPVIGSGSISLVAPGGYAICTGTCTVTVPLPSANQTFCIMNDDNVATAITLAALGSSAMYEAALRNGYGTAGTGTMVLSAAPANQVCIVGRDSTHYFTVSYTGSPVVN